MHNYLTNYRTPTCFDTIVSSLGSLKSIPCQVTQVFQMHVLVIHYQLLHMKRDGVETCSSVIICEIIVRLLVIAQNMHGTCSKLIKIICG